jgi:hypothetical protein
MIDNPLFCIRSRPVLDFKDPVARKYYKYFPIAPF